MNPAPMFDPIKHDLSTSYKFCGGCHHLHVEDEMNINAEGQGVCNPCSADDNIAKTFFGA